MVEGRGGHFGDVTFVIMIGMHGKLSGPAGDCAGSAQGKLSQHRSVFTSLALKAHQPRGRIFALCQWEEVKVIIDF